MCGLTSQTDEWSTTTVERRERQTSTSCGFSPTPADPPEPMPSFLGEIRLPS